MILSCKSLSLETPHYSANIEIVYYNYPKKMAKPAAIKAINEALKIVSFEELLEKTKRYAQNCKDIGKEMQYIPFPGTWFNRQGWNEPLETIAINKQKGNPQHEYQRVAAGKYDHLSGT